MDPQTHRPCAQARIAWRARTNTDGLVRRGAQRALEQLAADLEASPRPSRLKNLAALPEADAFSYRQQRNGGRLLGTGRKARLCFRRRAYRAAAAAFTGKCCDRFR